MHDCYPSTLLKFRGCVATRNCTAFSLLLYNPMEYVFLYNYFSLFLLCRPIPNVEVIVVNGRVQNDRYWFGAQTPAVTRRIFGNKKQVNREISNSTQYTARCYCHRCCPAELQVLQYVRHLILHLYQQNLLPQGAARFPQSMQCHPTKQVQRQKHLGYRAPDRASCSYRRGSPPHAKGQYVAPHNASPAYHVHLLAQRCSRLKFHARPVSEQSLGRVA